MCGFVGFYEGADYSHSEMIHELNCMSETLSHRGPDSHGSWFDWTQGIALAHRRLSIQDLSPLGHQPMHSSSNRYTIVFNGEIYNFIELRTILVNEGHEFHGNSDTEVMLASIERWGICRSLEKFVGMFAFALWDSHEQVLTLARDRLGEKPLYFGWQKNTFLFGSELKALRRHHNWKNDIDRDAITLLLRHNYIPSPHSIFKGISKLAPATFLTLHTKTQNISINNYWSLKDVVSYGINNPLQERPEEIVSTLEQKLLASIKGQMIADVPIGAFLSGGIDSSTIVSLMQSLSTSPVKTFTIGFKESEFNEANYAKAISERLGTDHTELYVTPEQTLDVIPHIAQIYDEPFADSSQIPTYLISKLARQRVTVSLSGDGGDELFCGYTRYYTMQKRWQEMQRYPKLLRLFMANLMKSIPISLLDKSLGFALKYFTDRNHYQAGERIYARAGGMLQPSLQLAYQHYISYWKGNEIVLNAIEPSYAFNNKELNLCEGTVLQQLQYLDALCYLPDDILTKIDRAAMANSLETRIPLLDHNLFEYVAQISPEINTLHVNGKWPLRQILYKYVPKELVERPKMGFAVPINSWLRGPLRDWAEALLDKGNLEREGFFNTDMIRKKWHAHLNKEGDFSFQLWGVLMFQSWREYW